jgi:hypothetical protein
MNNILKNKTSIEIVFIILMGIVMIFSLTGCNKQVFDFKYTFDKAVCYYNDDAMELPITKWNDYEGEQIQVISNGKTYLISTNNCYLVAE